MKNVINSLNYFGLVSLITLLVSCNSSDQTEFNPIPIGEGKLEVDGGSIWYKVSGEGSNSPVVLLHGGPGYSSFYLKPLEELGSSRQIIRYDQLGSGKSDFVSDTSLFTISHFVEELESLRNHLKVEKWHVLGHSWGTVLAFEYYRKYPSRVNSLILGSPCIDINAWEQSTNQLLQSLPDSLQKAVVQADSTGIYDDPLYEVAINTFNNKYVWGKNPIEMELDSMVNTANLSIYNFMWGPSEFSITGTLKNYNALNTMQDIDIPTLFTVGEFDEIQPSFVREMATKFKNSKVEVFPNSSHLTTWDAPEQNIKVVHDFLTELDSNITANNR
ncbi:proline iminopeptidase-family hydrolase [Algoriphagus sp. D3-2-R+10]|uniref:proline iminopeptidase-family hydrolase n=1 Tax=Algoriphagus aurantiacus TaxID=3103948 RepID=UPI002B3FD00D|nr:proline iminopeptidase-family hydrolase [Algoriphagus sp. D3-2-R+10]MEB2777566.1 proline iminopeptidase-family hydrolase [Algoriphagus sp. D3-2-R+10]